MIIYFSIIMYVVVRHDKFLGQMTTYDFKKKYGKLSPNSPCYPFLSETLQVNLYYCNLNMPSRCYSQVYLKPMECLFDFNLLLTNGHFHPYHFDESISNFRSSGGWSFSSLLLLLP